MPKFLRCGLSQTLQEYSPTKVIYLRDLMPSMNALPPAGEINDSHQGRMVVLILLIKEFRHDPASLSCRINKSNWKVNLMTKTLPPHPITCQRRIFNSTKNKSILHQNNKRHSKKLIRSLVKLRVNVPRWKFVVVEEYGIGDRDAILWAFLIYDHPTAIIMFILLFRYR